MKPAKLSKIVLLSASLLALAACENAKRELGLERTAPDEFAVVRRAPLAMPPDYALRPPEPGAPRPQEASAVAAAETTVFGGEPAPKASAGSAEQILLQKAGAGQARPDIRRIVDRETAAMPPASQPAVKKLLGIGKAAQPAASVVDAPREAERIKSAVDSGQPVTAGETPSREQ